MNFMLNLAYEKSTWYQSIGLERTHCTSYKLSPVIPLLLQFRTTLLGLSEIPYDPLLLGVSAPKT
jgi:hypothetical protein